MIDDIELRQLSVEMGVPVGIIEKDLAITCALYAISRRELRDHLVFKGGTAIKKIYYPRARFSEDLDFTAINLKKEEATTQLEALNNAEVNSIKFMEIHEDGYTHRGTRYRLPYTGPLNFRNSIRLDISFRDDVILALQERTALSEFSEDLTSKVKVLDFKELMAEKLRATMTRENPRDYYDAWAHLPKIDEKEPLRELVQRKCALAKYDYNPSRIFDEGVLTRIESAWRTQLQHLILEYVDFATIIPQLKDQTRFLFTRPQGRTQSKHYSPEAKTP